MGPVPDDWQRLNNLLTQRKRLTKWIADPPNSKAIKPHAKTKAQLIRHDLPKSSPRHNGFDRRRKRPANTFGFGPKELPRWPQKTCRHRRPSTQKRLRRWATPRQSNRALKRLVKLPTEAFPRRRISPPTQRDRAPAGALPLKPLWQKIRSCRQLNCSHSIHLRQSDE